MRFTNAEDSCNSKLKKLMQHTQVKTWRVDNGNITRTMYFKSVLLLSGDCEQRYCADCSLHQKLRKKSIFQGTE